MNRANGTRAEAFLLPAADGGHRFCLLHTPPAGRAPRGGVLQLPAFAEEMNKSRRAVALCARALAADGWYVLQLDLLGCGDSSGDFADARWETWLEDVTLAARWFAARQIALRWLWGVRLGALLAANSLERIQPAPDLLLWQPVTSGKQHLSQFLRLKAAERRLAADGEGTTTAALRARLAAGEPLEIAGYTLHPSLSRAIDAAELEVRPASSIRVCWMEVTATPGDELGPAAKARILDLRARGHRVQALTVAAAAFWQAVEIEDCPALAEATVAALAESFAEVSP
ncbi:MAG: hydrolase 2, exosortase A system-associated [Burkholderiaceae bacterium]|nr:hydrolase 2, exosortase A system-associated [Burkholderiaceae bacterium]